MSHERSRFRDIPRQEFRLNIGVPVDVVYLPEHKRRRESVDCMGLLLPISDLPGHVVVLYRPEPCLNKNGWMRWYFPSKASAFRSGWRKIGDLK
jgi:hypothetical protein